jgi:hypothetical protein
MRARVVPFWRRRRAARRAHRRPTPAPAPNARRPRRIAVGWHAGRPCGSRAAGWLGRRKFRECEGVGRFEAAAGPRRVTSHVPPRAASACRSPAARPPRATRARRCRAARLVALRHAAPQRRRARDARTFARACLKSGKGSLADAAARRRRRLPLWAARAAERIHLCACASGTTRTRCAHCGGVPTFAMCFSRSPQGPANAQRADVAALRRRTARPSRRPPASAAPPAAQCLPAAAARRWARCARLRAQRIGSFVAHSSFCARASDPSLLSGRAGEPRAQRRPHALLAAGERGACASARARARQTPLLALRRSHTRRNGGTHFAAATAPRTPPSTSLPPSMTPLTRTAAASAGRRPRPWRRAAPPAPARAARRGRR